MNIKTWSAKSDNLEIVVKNGWDWEWNTEEEIIINGKQEYYYSGSYMPWETKARMGLSFTKEINGKMIAVQVWTAWYFFWMACKILIDNKRVGGDRIVWFAK